MKKDFIENWLPEPFDTWLSFNMFGYLLFFIATFCLPDINSTHAPLMTGIFIAMFMTVVTLFYFCVNFFHIRRLILIIITYLPFPLAILWLVMKRW